MSPNFYRTKWSDYLGESRPYLDEYVVPNAAQICPQQLLLSGMVNPTYDGTYDRLYSYTGGSFDGGYIQTNILTPNIPFYAGSISGQTYAVYGRQSGTTYYTLISYFLLSGQYAGWIVLRSANDYFFNGFPINDAGMVGELNTTIDGIIFPSRGKQTLYGLPTTRYVSYPDICPTPTNPQPTPTNTPTPSITSTPTITPTNTPTPTVTPVPCFEAGTGFNAVTNKSFADGNSFFVLGGFNSYDGNSCNSVIKLFNNGTIDTSFPVAVFNTSPTDMLFETGNTYIFAGTFTTYSGVSNNRIIRLNTNGSINTSFVVGTGFNSAVETLALQSDGKIIAGGQFTTYKGVGASRIVRLNTDGSRDSTFVIGLGTNGTVTEVQVQSDGKILVAGSFFTYSGVTSNRIIRLNTDGSIDNTFNIGTGFDNTVNAMKIQSSGKIVCSGLFTTFNGVSVGRIARLNTDGSLDTTFNVGGSGFDSQTWISLQSDDKILGSGVFGIYNGTFANRIIRLNSDGSIDSSFNTGFGFNLSTTRTSVLSNGKIVVNGNFSSYNLIAASRITLLNQDGSSADCPPISPTPTPTRTVTPTNTQTPTNTPTITPTMTPSSTPCAICPEQLDLSYFSGSTQITPPFVNYVNAAGTFNRVYANLSTSFVAGFAKNIPGVFYPGPIDYGTYIGRNYAVWERNVGGEYFTLINYFTYPAGYVLIKTTGTTLVNGGTPLTQVIGISTTASTDGSIYYPTQGHQDVILSGNTNWYISYPCVCPTTTPTPTPTVTPTASNTPGLPPSPTPTVTATNTQTPTITPSVTSTPTKDIYLANVYDCFDCSFIGQDNVAFPIGTPVTVGQFYNDDIVSGLVYQIVSTTTGAATTNCILPGQSTCAAACAL